MANMINLTINGKNLVIIVANATINIIISCCILLMFFQSPFK